MILIAESVPYTHKGILVYIGICSTAPDLFNEGVEDGTSPAGVFTANKHPVLVSELGGIYFWLRGFSFL
jgi:hypothetical protein